MTGMAGVITGSVTQMKFGGGVASGSTQTIVLVLAAAAARSPRATSCMPANCPFGHMGALVVAFFGYIACFGIFDLSWKVHTFPCETAFRVNEAPMKQVD